MKRKIKTNGIRIKERKCFAQRVSDKFEANVTPGKDPAKDNYNSAYNTSCMGRYDSFNKDKKCNQFNRFI